LSSNNGCLIRTTEQTVVVITLQLIDLISKEHINLYHRWTNRGIDCLCCWDNTFVYIHSFSCLLSDWWAMTTVTVIGTYYRFCDHRVGFEPIVHVSEHKSTGVVCTLELSQGCSDFYVLVIVIRHLYSST